MDSLAMLLLPPGVTIRSWEEHDFPAIQQLCAGEGWNTPVDRATEALIAWRASNPALVAVEEGSIVGFVRTLSDGNVSTYVAELFVAPSHRGQGIAAALLAVCQSSHPGTRLDLLATQTSHSYYEHLGFRPCIGFRRSWEEYEAGSRGGDSPHEGGS